MKLKQKIEFAMIGEPYQFKDLISKMAMMYSDLKMEFTNKFREYSMKKGRDLGSKGFFELNKLLNENHNVTVTIEVALNFREIEKRLKE